MIERTADQIGGSARGYLGGASQQSRYGLLDGRLFCISIHRPPWPNVRICRAARVCAWQGIGVLRSWRQLLERPGVAVRVAEGNERAPRLNVHVTGLHTAFGQFPPRRLDIRHDNLDAFL